MPSLIANNDIAIEPPHSGCESSQLEANANYWPGLEGPQTLKIGTHGEQSVQAEKQKSSGQQSNRVLKPHRTTKITKRRSKNIHPTMIVARLQQSLQTDPSCSPKFKSECSKLLEQVKGLMYVEMGRPKSKDSLNISHMQDVTSVGRSESSQGSVSQLANDVFSIAGGSDSAPESSPSSKSRSQQSQGHVENSSPVHSRAQRSQSRVSRIYQCTYRACTSSFATKTDWKRHEESEKHWLQQKYMCLECDTSAVNYAGMMECLYCSGSAEDLGDIQIHNLQCDPARKLGRTFTRKDHFRDHLRDDHGISLDSTTSTWVYSIESRWPRQCGFCGYIVDTWAQRANHIEDHFKKGYRVSSWKLPFPRIRDPKGKGPRIDSDDDSENSSITSSSDNNGYSANRHCTTSRVATNEAGPKDMPQNKVPPGDHVRFTNTEETLACHRDSSCSPMCSRVGSRISYFYRQPEDRTTSVRGFLTRREQFLRVPDDGMYFFMLL